MSSMRRGAGLLWIVLLSTPPMTTLVSAVPPQVRPAEFRVQSFEIVLETVQGDSTTIIGGFKSVSGLDSETEVIEFREGGDTGIVRKIPGITKYSNIVLKRGIIDRDQNDLWLWRKAIIDGSSDRRDGSVVLLDRDGREVVRYSFTNAFPVAWRGFDLEADGNTIAVETIEIAVESLVRMQ